ncbi:MAG TPA: hypothetical protein V6D30_17345 [Leptolyngbyaceae cyanobacterium]
MTVLPKWFYDEFQQSGVNFEDTAQVEAFDRNQRSSSEEAEQALIEWLGISAGHTVIDLGAGTGTFAIQAGKAGAYVHAVDYRQPCSHLPKRRLAPPMPRTLSSIMLGF